MKGMQKIKRGSGFNGLLKYLLSHEKAVEDGRVIGGTMNGADVKTLSKEFNQVRSLRRDVDKPVWHNSLRLPAGDECSDYKWQGIVEDYMAKMGFDVHKTQYVIVKHDDENAVHIAANRIMNDGSLYLGRNENLASTRHISALEKTHGLRITKGLEYDENNRIKPGQAVNAGRKSAKEVQKEKRTGEAVPKDIVRNAIAAALAKGACSAPEFAKRVRSAGIGIRANISSAETKTLSGFSFEYEDNSIATGNTNRNTVVFKGSQVGYSLKALQDAGISYSKEADFIALSVYSDKPEIQAVAAQASTAKQTAWDAQAVALDADGYIVHCDRPADAQTLDRQPPTKPYTAAQVRDEIPRLERMEVQGYNVAVEPVSSKWTYIRLSDAKPAKVDKLHREGYTPNLVLQIAPVSHEAVFRVPKESIGTKDEQTARLFAEDELSRSYGVGVEPKAKIPLAGFKVNGFVAAVRQAVVDVCTKAVELFKRSARTGKAIPEPDVLPPVTKAPEPPRKGPSIDEDDDALEQHIKREQAKAANVPTQGNGAAIHGTQTPTQTPKKHRSYDDDLSL